MSDTSAGVSRRAPPLPPVQPAEEVKPMPLFDKSLISAFVFACLAFMHVWVYAFMHRDLQGLAAIVGYWWDGPYVATALATSVVPCCVSLIVALAIFDERNKS